MRIKIASILLIAFILPLLAVSQQRWYLSFGRPGIWETPMCLKESYDKGYVISGSFINDKGLISKTSINGELLWDKVFVRDNLFINFFYQGINLYGRNVFVGYSGPDPLVVSMNACGEVEWCYTFYNPEHFIGGYFRSAELYEDGHTLALANLGNIEQESQLYFFYFDAYGELVWMKEYAKIVDHPDLYRPIPYTLDIIDGEYFISGICYYRLDNNPDVYALRPMFIMIDSNFNEEWLLAYGQNISPFVVLGYGLGVLKENDSVYRGYGDYLYANKRITSFLNFSSEGFETDFVGIPCNLINDSITGNSPMKIININDSLFMVSGFVNYHISNDDQADILYFVMSSTGNLYEHQILLNTEPTMNSVIKTDNNQFVFTGGIKQAGEWDILLYKLYADLSSAEPVEDTITYDYLCDNLPIVSDTIDLSGCGIITGTGAKIQTPEEYYSNLSVIHLSVLPNPASNKVTIEIANADEAGNLQVKCFSATGSLMMERSLEKGTEKIELNISSWQSGLYFIVVNNDKGKKGSAKFVVK